MKKAAKPYFLNRFNQHIASITPPVLELESSFTLKEHLFIKAYLFNVLCRRAKRLCRKYHVHHMRNFSPKGNEAEIMDNYLSYYIIQDLLDTGNYTLEGIAHEINIHIDVVFDIGTGIKVNHSPLVLYRLIQLHITVKRTWHADLFRRLLVVLGYW